MAAEDSTYDGPLSLPLVGGGELSMTGQDMIRTLPPLNKSPMRLCFINEKARVDTMPLYNVLWAELSATNLLIISIARPTSKTALRVGRWPVRLASACDVGRAFVQELLARAYPDGTQRRRRARVLVNPHAGRGLAPSLWTTQAKPVFDAARWILDVTETTSNGQATEVAEALDIATYTCVVVCSGDGLVHEVFNGLGRRADAGYALANVAIGHIPCGTGNALSCNINGTAAPGPAALAVIKGRVMTVDLVSLTHPGSPRRTLSFLSQALGMIAESDLGTEHLRWMGDSRITCGYLVRALTRRVYPCDLAVKTVASDKHAVLAWYRDARAGDLENTEQSQQPQLHDGDDPESYEAEPGAGLPPHRFGTVDDPLPADWDLVKHEDLSNLYAGTMPFMSDGMNFFPAALPGRGVIDLITTQSGSFLSAVKLTLAVGSNRFFDSPAVDYRKVVAFRVVPRQQETGFLSVDGEHTPFAPFQAEVHRGLGRVISRSGVFEAPGPNGAGK